MIDTFINLLKEFGENKWAGIISLTLTLIGILLSIVGVNGNKRKKDLIYIKKSEPIISSENFKNILGTELYNNRKIENLTATTIAIWNGGNETLNTEDQAPTDKIRVIVKNDKIIYSSKLIYESYPTNNIKIKDYMTFSKYNNIINFNFDYLDKNQGAIIKIIHSSNDSKDIEVLGTIKGFGKIKESYNIEFDYKTSGLSNKRYMGIFFIIMGVYLYFSKLFIFSKTLVIFITSIYFLYGIMVLFRKYYIPSKFIKTYKKS